MQLLNIATAITLYAFLAAITLPFLLTLLYAATGVDLAGIRHTSPQSAKDIESTEGRKDTEDTEDTEDFDLDEIMAECTEILTRENSLPDLGPELEGQALYQEIDRVLSAPSPLVMAQSMAKPSAVLTIPSEAPETDLEALTIRQLKALASERKLPRYGSMRKAELIRALS